MASGANASILWGFELTAAGVANFGAGANLVNKAFGYGLEIDPNIKRNLQRRYNPGSRNYAAAKGGKVVGGVKIDFDFCDPWVIEAFIGGHGAISGSAGAYGCTFSEADCPPTLEIDICTAVVPGTTYSLRKLMGVLIKNASIGFDSSSDEPVRLTLDGDYANEVKSAPASFTTQIDPDQDNPITFAQCKVYTSSDGSSYTQISNVDKFNLKVDQGAELRHTGGSQIAARAKYGQRTYDIELTKLYTDPTVFLEKLFGSANGPSASNPTAIPYMKLELSAETGATCSFILTDVRPDDHSQSTKGPEEELVENVNLIAKSCSVVVAGWDATEQSRY